MAYVKPEEHQGDNFTQAELPPISEALPNPIVPVIGGAILQTGDFISPNYRKYRTGWKFNSRGEAEFQFLTLGNPNSGNYLTWDGTTLTVNGALAIKSSLFNNGSDGSAVLNGSTTFSWATLAAGVYTLTRDVKFINLTINSGVTLVTANYIVYGTGTLTNAGTIHNNGNPGGAGGSAASGGAAGTAGAAVAAGTFSASKAGVVGGAGVTAATGNGSAGTNGLAANPSLGNISGVVGGAGESISTSTGGTGGTAGAPTLETVSLKIPASFANSAALTVNTETSIANIYSFQGSSSGTSLSGPAGSGGGGSGANAGAASVKSAGGGGSGSVGGIVAIFFASIINTGIIESLGGVGGIGGDGFGSIGIGAGAAGGGGGGGDGGVVVLLYITFVNTGTLSLTGGVGGTKGVHSVNGNSDQTNGSNGNTGVYYEVKIT